MPGRVRSYVRPVRSSSRRKTSWTSGPGGGGGQAEQVVIAATGSSIWSTALVPLVEQLTIARIRGELLLFLKTAAAVNDGFTGACGLMVVPDEAFQAGVASIPSPLDDIDHDEWMWYKMFNLKAASVIAGGASTDADHLLAVSAAVRFEIDNKAMRKFPVGMSLVAAIEVVEQGVATMTANISLRTLVFLP